MYQRFSAIMQCVNGITQSSTKSQSAIIREFKKVPTMPKKNSPAKKTASTKSKRIAVKVIDPRGNEVMKVARLDGKN